MPTFGGRLFLQQLSGHTLHSTMQAQSACRCARARECVLDDDIALSHRMDIGHVCQCIVVVHRIGSRAVCTCTLLPTIRNTVWPQSR